MSRYIVVDLEELKKSPYIVIDLSDIGETSPQITQINLFRKVTHSDNPYIVVDLDELKDNPYIVVDLDELKDNPYIVVDLDELKDNPYIVVDLDELKDNPYIVIDLDNIDGLSSKSTQINLIRNVISEQSTQIDLIRQVLPDNYRFANISLIRSVVAPQSTQIDLIRDVSTNLSYNDVNIDLKRSVISEQSTQINLIRNVRDGFVKFDFNFVGIGKLVKPGICFDVHCCCIVRTDDIVAKIVEEKPLYVEQTNLNVKPFVFFLIKPANAASIPYEDISDSVSYYEYEVLPLFPDRSNKGYNK